MIALPLYWVCRTIGSLEWKATDNCQSWSQDFVRSQILSSLGIEGQWTPISAIHIKSTSRRSIKSWSCSVFGDDALCPMWFILLKQSRIVSCDFVWILCPHVLLPFQRWFCSGICADLACPCLYSHRRLQAVEGLIFLVRVFAPGGVVVFLEVFLKGSWHFAFCIYFVG